MVTDGAGADMQRSCSLWLESNDENHCRFAVKNAEKEKQSLASIQMNGYVEYKARYPKKRGQKNGYGTFHIAFLPADR